MWSVSINCALRRDHDTNEEAMRMAGMERLQYIVTKRRRKIADHVLGLQRERPPHTQCTGCQKTAEERVEAEEDMAKHFQRIPGREARVSADMEPEGSPVTVRDGEFSSPEQADQSKYISLCPSPSRQSSLT